ncbi:DoxX family protein [Chloroflexi bacterium TSY]|nr:DoxX family protein [Chloroflexi bacterium TSY]
MNFLSRYAHWALRLAMASVFIVHGVDKFLNPGMAEMMGLPLAVWLLVAAAEVGGALLILVGGFGFNWATRLGALALLPVMLGAIFMVHWGQWSFMASATHPVGGIEFQVTLALLALYFLLQGNSADETNMSQTAAA